MTADADSPATSMLAHLANRFTNLTETLATEALGYILSQSAPARGALQEMLMSGDANVGPIATVQTEVIGKKMERIDLSAYNEAYEERILIEAKFWAELTDNQPSEYLERLPNDGRPSALLFVAPEARLEMLWPEVCARAQKKFAVDRGIETGALRTARIDGSERRLMLTSWRTMLDEMSRKAGGDMTAVKDIEQLQALCDQQDRAAFLPLNAGELGPGFSKRAIDMYNLFHDVFNRVHKEGIWEKIGHSKLGANFGHYFSSDVGDIWVGIHYEFGTLHRETPFWVMLGYSGNAKLDAIRKRLDAARRENGLDYVDTEYGKTPVSLVPIHLPAGVEYEAVLNSVVGQIRNIARALA